MIVEFREVLEHNKRYSIHVRAKFSRIQSNFTLHLSTGCFIRKNRAEVRGLGNHHKQTLYTEMDKHMARFPRCTTHSLKLEIEI